MLFSVFSLLCRYFVNKWIPICIIIKKINSYFGPPNRNLGSVHAYTMRERERERESEKFVGCAITYNEL